jgi:DNA polymerase III alpha subunit
LFQLESTAVHVCQKVKPKNISDIALITALIRPAAKDIIPEVLKVRNGEKEMTFPHPSVKRAFEFTYGYGLFEESLMFLAKDVCGWDLKEADKLRKLTKEKGKNPEKVAQWKKEFIEGAVSNGLDEQTGIDIWEGYVESFGAYGFNVPHATLYSFISFQTAWLKTHYTIEFLTASLISEVNSNSKDAKENINRIKNELRAKKVKVLPPDINTSDLSWKIVDSHTLMTGLDSLKFMSESAVPEILQKRPFSSFEELLINTKVPAQSIQAMAASGSLDSFGISRKKMFYYASDFRAKLSSHLKKLNTKVKRDWAKENGFKKKVKEEIYLDKNNVVHISPAPTQEQIDEHVKTFVYPFPEEDDWTIKEKFALEEFYMGEGLSGTNFDRYVGFFDKNQTVPFKALVEMFPWKYQHEDERANRKANTHYLDNHGIRPLEGIITKVFSFIVKKEDSKIFGQEMARITLMDPWGDEMSLLCFPEAWDGLKSRVEKELSRGKSKVEPGIAIRIICSFQWESESITSLILSDVIDYCDPPQVPKDRKSKKLKLPRKTSLKNNDLEELSKEELVDILESEMIDEGYSIEEEE